MGKEKTSDEEDSKPPVAKNAIELQRFKLEKLMKNPEKPVVIPDRLKEKKMPHVPEFVRNVMGSSAGAGSGEFHVYRHLRRKEYARQKFIQEKSEKQLLEEAYHQKLIENIQAAEGKTAKKRAKRLKNKAKKKLKKNISQNKSTDNVMISKEETTTESDSENESGKEHEHFQNNTRLEQKTDNFEMLQEIPSENSNVSSEKEVNLSKIEPEKVDISDCSRNNSNDSSDSRH